MEGPELTIDLTDSPPISPPASPVVSQSLGQPGNPASPAMQCPVCLDTFSAIRSRGEHLLVWFVYLSSSFQARSWSAQCVATCSAGAVSASVSSPRDSVPPAGGGSLPRTITLSSSEDSEIQTFTVHLISSISYKVKT